MKKNIFRSLILFCLTLLPMFAVAQSYTIYKSNGQKLTLSHAEVDSIVFSNAAIPDVKEHEFVDLGLSVKWATCNVGAEKPEEYGLYFAWAENSAKEQYTKDTSKTYQNSSFGDISGNPEFDAAAAIWGGECRMPTEQEAFELAEKCQWEVIDQNGHTMFKATGPNGNSIFFPASGMMFADQIYDAEEAGGFWTSTPFGENYDEAYEFWYDKFGHGRGWFDRYYGRTVRAVIDK